MTPDDPVHHVSRLGGVASLAALKELVAPESIADALATGRLHRLHRTKVILPAVSEARTVAMHARGQVSHLTAAMAHGWKVLRPPDRQTMVVRRGTNVRRRAGVEVHYVSRVLSKPGSLTDPIETVIDCARSLPFIEALAVADSALRSQRVGRAQLLASAEASPRTGRARALRVVKCADPRAANPFESGLRAIALDVSGFAAVAQCPVPGVGHADVGDVERRIAPEAESFEFHAQREAFGYDTRRYTAMVCKGWLVARFIWDDVMHRPAYVTQVIEDLIELRGVSSTGESRSGGRVRVPVSELKPLSQAGAHDSPTLWRVSSPDAPFQGTACRSLRPRRRRRSSRR